MENLNIEAFLQYGVLGIIAWVFLKMTSKLFNSQLEQFKLLLDTVIEKDGKPIKDIEESVSLTQQMMNNHQKYLIENIHNLTDKVNSCLNEFRTLLNSIEKRYNMKLSCEKLEFLLTQKTALTQSEIRDIIDNAKIIE